LLRVGAREFPHDEKQDQGRDRGGAEAPREKRRRDCHYSRDHGGPSALLVDNDVRTYLNAFPTRRFFENGNVRLLEAGLTVSAFRFAVASTSLRLSSSSSMSRSTVSRVFGWVSGNGGGRASREDCRTTEPSLVSTSRSCRENEERMLRPSPASPTRKIAATSMYVV